MTQKYLYLFCPPHAHYGWFIVVFLWIAHIIYLFIAISLGVFGPLIKQELGPSNTKFGFLCSAMSIGSMVIYIPAVTCCDTPIERKIRLLF